MSTVLDRILHYKAEEVAAAKGERDREALEDAITAQGRTRGFRDALVRAAQAGRPGLIAEVKKASPSKGLIRADFDPAQIAAAYARGGADCLSVLTDGPSFQGQLSYLALAREAAPLPALRKDFMIDLWQVDEARAAGADAILIIMAAVDDALAADLLAAARERGMDSLVEVHDAEEMMRAKKLGADLIGVNNRDLHTFETRLETTETLAESIPPNALLITESGIATPADVHRLSAAGAHAFLVGESLMRHEDPGKAAADLMARDGDA